MAPMLPRRLCVGRRRVKLGARVYKEELNAGRALVKDRTNMKVKVFLLCIPGACTEYLKKGSLSNI